MNEPSPAGAKCPHCHLPLGANGSCLVCLLRGGLSDEGTFDIVPPSAATTVYGDFEVSRREDGSLWELGRGAMGVTYRAVDRVLYRPVALKVIQLGPMPISNGGLSAALRERFLREARAAAALRHTNVAGVFQLGASSDSELCYCAMELVEGETLEARVRRDGPLDVGTVLEIAAQVAAALVAAGARGLIHRDLKPSNLMLEDGGTPVRPEVKVIDFGLAKAITATDEQDLTQGGFVGTPTFASPEQLSRQPMDARTDIYSLGVTLWYALTGRVPFGGKTLTELRDHPDRSAPPVAQLTARKVPPAFVALLCAMLAEDPAQRPESAREFLMALEVCKRSCLEQNRLPAKGRDGLRKAAFALGAALGLVLLGAGLAWWVVRSRPGEPAFSNRVSPAPPLGLVAPEKSVAVLPFANLSTDKDSAFFADGVQDEVLTDLAKVADLKVISRTSVMQYRDPGRNLREIGQMLGVAYVVEGSVQRAGNQVRVTAQLIDARTDTHRWADKYDRPLDDVFTIQSDIAQAIAGQLQAAISPQEHAAIAEAPTRDEVAYELYLRARAIWDDLDEFPNGRESCRAALDLLQRATARDPQFVRAFTLMTLVQGNTFRNIERTAANAAATRNLAETVVRLRPGSTEADMAMGILHYMVDFDFARARQDFAAVVRRSPNDAVAQQFLARSLRRQGRLEEALAVARRSLELDPESNGNFSFYLEVLEGLRRYAEINADIDRRLALYPRFEILRIFKARVLLVRWADTRAARAELARLPAGFDPDGIATFLRLQCSAMERDFGAMARDLAACPAFIYYSLRSDEQYVGDIARYRGDAAAATAAYEAAYQRLEATARTLPNSDGVLFALALVDAALGRRDEALESGRRALAISPPDDMRDWPDSMVSWARVLVRAGEREEAIRVLQTVATQPYGPEYGPLRLHPDWDPLRGDPRFEAIVASLAPDRPAAGSTNPTVPEKSVAVLPFDNFSEDKDSAFFADGVQDEVLTDLAKVADLKVISRTSVMPYKDPAKRNNLRQIGQALGVAHVVEGSVQRVGNKVRVIAQLIDARTDTHLWADKYERPLNDVFAIQSEIAQAIAGQLQAAISPQEHVAMTEAPTHDLEAYGAYLRAREFWNSFDVQDPALFQKTLDILSGATTRDPNFARAFAFAVYIQALSYRIFSATPAQAAVVRDLAATVDRLRPGSGEAHLSLGTYHLFVTHDYLRAHAEATEAVRLLPNDAGALYLLGMTEESLEHWQAALPPLQKAAGLDPEDPDPMNDYTALLAGAGRYAEAVAVLDRRIGSQVQAFWAHAYKSEVLLAWKGDVPAARAELVFLPPDYDPQGVVTAQKLACDFCEHNFTAAEHDLAACRSEEIYGVPRAFFQGCIARYRGDGAAAKAAFATARGALEEGARVGPEPGRSLLYLATVDAALGRKEEALAERRAGLDKKLPEHNTEGPRMALLGARVLAWADERSEAIQVLQNLANTPAGPGYGLLRLDPAWDGLRNDPRFMALVASHAPKQ